MRRDWDLLRQQMTDNEEGRNVFAGIPKRLTQSREMSCEEFEVKGAEQRSVEARIAGNLELLQLIAWLQSPDSTSAASTYAKA